MGTLELADSTDYIKTEDDPLEYLFTESSSSSTIASTESSPQYASPEWTQQDEYFATMFRPWEELPLQETSPEEEFIQVLTKLEDLIVSFEKYINHSELGFDAWRQRHKRAAEAQIAILPDWPKLRVKGRWLDFKWEERYSYLVHQRQRCIERRLETLRPFLATRALSRFASMRAAHADRAQRALFSPYSTKNRRPLPGFWSEPVDSLIRRLAKQEQIESAPLLGVFWGLKQELVDPYGLFKTSHKLTSLESGKTLEQEDNAIKIEDSDDDFIN